MGKKSRLEMLKEKIVLKAGNIHEDEEGIIKVISAIPLRLEVTPKHDIDIKKFHLKFIERMINKKVFNRFNCYISENGKKVILEK